MDNKILIVIVAAAVLVVAGVAIVLTSSGSSDDVPSDSVRYKGNGGSTGSGSDYYDYKGTEVMDCLFTKSGSHFSSWNTKSDGSGTAYAVGSTVPLKTILYAQWSSSNAIGSVNMYSNIFNLYVAEKGQEKMVNIDSSTADIASKDAILVLAAKDGSEISIDDSNRVVVKVGKDTYAISLSISVQGLSLGNPEILTSSHPSAYYDINQNTTNQSATLSMSVVKTSSS